MLNWILFRIQGESLYKQIGNCFQKCLSGSRVHFSDWFHKFRKCVSKHKHSEHHQHKGFPDAFLQFSVFLAISWFLVFWTCEGAGSSVGSTWTQKGHLSSYPESNPTTLIWSSHISADAGSLYILHLNHYWDQSSNGMLTSDRHGILYQEPNLRLGRRLSW